MAKKKYSERQQRSRRASKLREKVKEGRPLTADEKEWLAAYELAKSSEVAARVDAVTGKESAVEDPQPGTEADPTEGVDDKPDDIEPEAEATKIEAPPPPPTAPPLPRPPRVERASEADDDAKASKKKAASWRAKYESDAGDGREETCKYVADQWHGALRALADQIKASGVDPIVDPDKLYGAIILTVDEVMPAQVRLSPRARALAGTTAIVVHRFVRRKEIAEIQKTETDRKEHQKWQAERIKNKERTEAEADTARREAATAATAAAAQAATATASGTNGFAQGTQTSGVNSSAASRSPAERASDIEALNGKISRAADIARGAADAPEDDSVII